MPKLSFNGRNIDNQYDLTIDTDSYPYKASLYIWTMSDDEKAFDKRASELVGEDIVSVEWGGGNGHEDGIFIRRADFERDYCKHKRLKLEGCSSCDINNEESKLSFDDINACPFCGMCNKMRTEGVPYRLKVMKFMDEYYIQCDICMAEGPTGKSNKAAIRLWNKRRPSLYEKLNVK